MTVSICRQVIALSALSMLQACAVWLPSENASSSERPSIVEVGTEEMSPFKLSVVDELYDGTMLHVQARIEVKTDWQVAGAALRLRGIEDGSVVEEESVPVKEIAASALKPGKGSETVSAGATIETVLSIDASSISDYQLEMIWGEDEGQEPAVMAALVLRDIETRKNLLCASTPCQVAYGMRGKLYNAGKATVSEAELGIGYVFVEQGASLDLSGVIPENEELLRIPGLNIGPGGMKPFNLKLSRTVPERTDGAYVPVIRVISYR